MFFKLDNTTMILIIVGILVDTVIVIVVVDIAMIIVVKGSGL